MNKPISFNPEFAIGDLVSPVTEPEMVIMVMGYNIFEVDEDGYVASYAYNTHGTAGWIDFKPREIQEALINKNKGEIS